MVDEYWNSLNVECTGSDCTGVPTIKTDAVATLGEKQTSHINIFLYFETSDGNWADDSDVTTMTGLLTTARDTINTDFIAHFR